MPFDAENPPMVTAPGTEGRLRRDLGALQSYAALLGMLVGAGIFVAIRDAWQVTGPSVVLGYLVLAPAVLAISIPYAVIASTSIGQAPGGEYATIAAVLRWPRVAAVGAWLKIISYIGALAYLVHSMVGHGAGLFDAQLGELAHRSWDMAVLALFTGMHALGVRWFARAQVAMCAVLGVAVVVLVVPGLFRLRADAFTPWFKSGVTGFGEALPPLFFAFAGFEALAQTGGEVKDSTARLPRVFVIGIAVTTLVFLALAIVIVGTLTPEVLAVTDTPAIAAAAGYLPDPLVDLIALGVVMAIATSLNASMLVPCRLGWMLARDHRLPQPFGWVSRSGVPLLGLLATSGGAALLLLAGGIGLALNIAVFALVLLYALHSLTYLVLPRRHPSLYAEARLRLPRWVGIAVALTALAALGVLIAQQVMVDLRQIAAGTAGWTVLELTAAWMVVGLLVTRRRP